MSKIFKANLIWHIKLNDFTLSQMMLDIERIYRINLYIMTKGEIDWLDVKVHFHFIEHVLNTKLYQTKKCLHFINLLTDTKLVIAFYLFYFFLVFFCTSIFSVYEEKESTICEQLLLRYHFVRRYRKLI